MGLTVKIRSKHEIKPSSPTPKHLNTVKLSVLDQFSACVHMPLIFYYQCPVNQTDSSELDILLEQSLSQTLVDFYPFAGRIDQDNSSIIRCNDDGVEYYEADVSTNLTQLLANPNVDELLKLLPFPPASATKKSLLAVVQVNRFSCGAMAISVCTLHKIADAATLVAFANAWAWATKVRSSAPESGQNSFPPIFNAATIFPPIDGIPEIVTRKEKMVCKRLVFDKEKLDALQQSFAVASVDDGSKRPPTRPTLVSAYIWMQLIKGARLKTNPPKTFVARQPIDLRTITSTPVPLNCCGNLYSFALADAPISPTTDLEYPQLVEKLRAAVKLRQIDLSNVEKLQAEAFVIELRKLFNNYLSSAVDVDNCAFSNCVKVPIYEVDFGWGKPIWVSSAPLPIQAVLLYTTKCGQGIEAWVNLIKHQGNNVLDREFTSLTTITTLRPRL